MGNIVSAASAFRLSKSYLPAHSTFYNAVSISLRSFADAARMWCAEAKCFATEARDLVLEMQPVCGVLRQSPMTLTFISMPHDAAHMWC